MGRLFLSVVAAFVLFGAAQPKAEEAAQSRRLMEAKARLATFVSPTIANFASEDEFLAYAKALRESNRYSMRDHRLLLASLAQDTVQSDSPTTLCPETIPECADPSVKADGDDAIVVTGSRVVVANPSITNNQMQGVEEGDIVKQVGQYLVVLQNGRLYAVDIEASRAGKLELADKFNVYLDRRDDSWYDEVLVFGDRVLVTGYSYEAEATTLAVFHLSDRGKFSREGRFYLSSNDYYSSSNYATRMIGDRLVIYTPFDIDQFSRSSVDWPVVRRWTGQEERRTGDERRFFDARRIAKPLTAIADATVHTISVCPLGESSPARPLECSTTGFVGPRASEWYVTNDHAYLWTVNSADNSRDCEPSERFSLRDAPAAYVYRLRLDNGSLTVAGARGTPFDQFSLQEADGRMRALLNVDPDICWNNTYEAGAPSYLDMQGGAFDRRLREIDVARYTSLPRPGSAWIANRFSGKYLLYGGLSRYRSGLPAYDPSNWNDDPERLKSYRSNFEPKPVYVVPIDNPKAVTPVVLGHTLIRLDIVGENGVATGYRNRQGLSVSLIDLRRRPQLGSSVALDGRFESEGRSHAFVARVDKDGSGILGLPTVPKLRGDERYSWRSGASDVSFLTFDRNTRLTNVGLLERKVDYDDSDGGLEGEACEVSCVDWYGNSRPIFTGGRIFGLTGVELIEGRIDRAVIDEVRRLNFGQATPRP